MHIYSLTSEVEKACREKRRVRSEAQLSLRKTSSVVWISIVISRAGSSPADDAKCRMAEVCRKATLGSVLAWRAASLLLIRLLFVLKPPL